MPPSSTRLTYSKIIDTDEPYYLQLAMNADVMKYITGKGLSKEEALARLASVLEVNAKHADFGFFLVRMKETSTFLGLVKFDLLENNQVEVGYSMLPEFWGNQYATEMTDALIIYAMSMPDIKYLIGVVEAENPASKKVLTKNGFELAESTLKEGVLLEYYQLGL